MTQTKKNKTQTVKRKIKTGLQFRSFDLNREAVDEENRSVELAFSSEEPVERWFGTEVLSHDSKHVDLGRLNGGGALLVDHDMRDHIGTVEEASIDKDRRGRAIVRFGRSARAEEIFNDVMDGIRKHVSVGYRIHEIVEDKKKGTFTATRWEPYEISMVSVPADATVGVGRSEESDAEFETTIIEERVMPSEETKPAKQETTTPAVDVEGIRKSTIEDTRKVELARINEIDAMGKELGLEDLARKLINDGTELGEARGEFLRNIKDAKPTPAGGNAEIGLTQAEAKRFSLARAILALANPNSRQAQENAAFEMECSRAVAQQRGIDPQGIFVPHMSRNGFVNTNGEGKYVPGISVPKEVQRADLNVTTDAQGGYLVDTTLMSGSFIDVLRNTSALAGMGATMMDDLTGDIAIPAKLAAGSSAWLATEGANAAQSDMTFRQVALTPKTAATYTEYTRQLLLQSSLSVDSLIRNDIAAGMALLLDLAGLYGSGSSGQPTGIANTSGIGNPTTWAAATPTWAEVVALESAVANANALNGNLGYIMETAMRGSLKTTSKAGTEAIFIMNEGGELNGYNTRVSNQVTSGDMFFGNWADLLIGLWGGLDILIDPYTNSLSGTIRVVAHQSMDVAVRHAASFALGNDTV